MVQLNNQDYFTLIGRAALLCTRGDDAIRSVWKTEGFKEEAATAIDDYNKPQAKSECLETIMRDIIISRRAELKVQRIVE